MAAQIWIMTYRQTRPSRKNLRCTAPRHRDRIVQTQSASDRPFARAALWQNMGDARTGAIRRHLTPRRIAADQWTFTRSLIQLVADIPARSCADPFLSALDFRVSPSPSLDIKTVEPRVQRGTEVHMVCFVQTWRCLSVATTQVSTYSLSCS